LKNIAKQLKEKATLELSSLFFFLSIIFPKGVVGIFSIPLGDRIAISTLLWNIILKSKKLQKTKEEDRSSTV
jgi:hypothetical protein